MTNREDRTDVPHPDTNSVWPLGLLGSAIFFSVFTNILMLTGPLFMLQVYDRVLASRSDETLAALFILVTLLYFFFWLLDHARGRIMARIGTELHARLSERSFRAGLAKSTRKTGGVSRALQQLTYLRDFLGSHVVLALFDAWWTPLFLALIFVFHPWLGWLAVVGGGLLVATTLLNQWITARAEHERLLAARDAQALASEIDAAVSYIRAQGMGPALLTRWLSAQDRMARWSTVAGDRNGLFTSFARAARMYLQSAMLALGAWLVIRDELTAGAIIAASILLGRALSPVESLLAGWSGLQRAVKAWRDVADLVATHAVDPPRIRLPHPTGRLEVQNLTVQAPYAGPPLLRDISFVVDPGQALGIIGNSGSGKTTLARVLAGLVTPVHGEVRLGGATLDQYGPEVTGRYIGYLPQDLNFFEGTIAENIAQMSAAPDAGRVVSAATRAGVHHTVLQLPDAYDTIMSRSASVLSGGQRQRIALARAFYNDPVLLILDEPNSALDAQGSEALGLAIQQAKSNGSAIVIMTHRPTAISACDMLLVIERGRVVGYGPRDEVIRATMQNADEVTRMFGASGA